MCPTCLLDFLRIWFFQTVADGYFTTQRLRYFNDTANNLSIEVGKVDPSRLQVAPVLEDLDALESELKSIYRRWH